MRQTKSKLRRTGMIETMETRRLLSGTPANFTFTDNFTPAPSSAWDSYAGNWTAANGQYYAQNPVNIPFATTELPYKVGDFTETVTANNLTDGGLWIHNDGTDKNGIVLVLGGNGYGQGDRGGYAGTSIYWQAIVDGTNYVGITQDEVDNVFVPGSTHTITVKGVGDTYSAYIDGSSTPATTLTTTEFPTGQIGLYDDQPNTAAGGSGAPMTFSDFSLTASDQAATLTPVITGKLPTIAIAGQKTSVRQSLSVSDNAGEIFSGTTTTRWFLDTGTNLDSSAISLTSPVTKTYKLKPNQHARQNLSLSSLPSNVPSGTYYLIAEVTDAGGSSVAVSGSTITVQTPVVSLSAGLAAAGKITSGGTLTILNGGNITDVAKFTQSVGFSTDAAGMLSSGLSVTTVRTLKIGAGRSIRFHVGVSKSQLKSLVAGDSYYLTVTESDTTGHTVTAVAAAPFTAS